MAIIAYRNAGFVRTVPPTSSRGLSSMLGQPAHAPARPHDLAASGAAQYSAWLAASVKNKVERASLKGKDVAAQATVETADRNNRAPFTARQTVCRAASDQARVRRHCGLMAPHKAAEIDSAPLRSAPQMAAAMPRTSRRRRRATAPARCRAAPFS